MILPSSTTFTIETDYPKHDVLDRLRERTKKSTNRNFFYSGTVTDDGFKIVHRNRGYGDFAAPQAVGSVISKGKGSVLSVELNLKPWVKCYLRFG